MRYGVSDVSRTNRPSRHENAVLNHQPARFSHTVLFRLFVYDVVVLNVAPRTIRSTAVETFRTVSLKYRQEIRQASKTNGTFQAFECDGFPRECTQRGHIHRTPRRVYTALKSTLACFRGARVPIITGGNEGNLISCKASRHVIVA